MSERPESPPDGAGWSRVVGRDGLVARVDGAAFEGRPALEVLTDPAAFGGVLLKENRRRTVHRVRLGSGELVVKQYRERGAADVLKGALGRSRARREWSTAAAMVAAGLPAPAPVAWARRGKGPLASWSAFAMRAVEDARPLGGYLEERFSPGDGRRAEKRPWVEAAAALLARLHAAGFDHRDYHGGNLLVEGGAAGRAGRLVVVDLHRVERTSRVQDARRVHALADLVHTLRFALDPEDAAAVVAAYLAADGRPAAQAGRWTRLVERACARREARRLASRTRRCVRDGTGFAPLEAGGVQGFARREVSVDALFEGVVRARAALASGAAVARSIARRSSVAIADVAGRGVAVKQYEGDGRRSMRGRVSGGRARRAYVAAHGLHVRGVPVPAVVAWLRTPDRSFLVVDEVAGGTPLSAASFRLAPGAADAGLAPRVADAVADLLVRLADARATVNDLSPKNVLLQRGAAGEVGAWLCDFDGVRLGRAYSRERWLHALAQLNDVAPAVGIRPRLRVLRRLASRVPALAARGTAREVARRTAVRASKQLRPPSPASIGGGAP